MNAAHELVLRLEPELTIYGAAALRQALAQFLEGAPAGMGTLALDLADVCEIDSAGVQLLLAARRQADAGHLPLLLRAHSAAVNETFALLGLDDQARGAQHDA